MKAALTALIALLLLNSLDNPAVPPRITSAPVLVALEGQPYVYDVDAAGEPAASFILVDALPGMVLDAGTGVLTWTPAITGTFDLAIEAVNQAGTDRQTFSLTVQPQEGYRWPEATWPTAAPEEVGMDPERLAEAQDFALTGGGAGYIIRHGRLALAWGDLAEQYELRSTTKSIAVTALGLAVKAGLLSLDDKAQPGHPSFGIPPESNAASGWLGEITLRQLASHTAGFDFPGDYAELLFQPGTMWAYSDSGVNWLAEIVTLALGEDLNERMWREVFTPLGIPEGALVWRENLYRPVEINGIKNREFASGIRSDVDALARLGYLYLRRGSWKGVEVLTKSFIDEIHRPAPGAVGLPERDSLNDCNASDHYGLLWWTNADGSLANVPRDTYWSWGADENLVLVIPSLDIVAARVGFSLQGGGSSSCYSVLQPFIEPIAQSVQNAVRAGQPPRLGVTSPVPGATYLQGQAIPIAAQAVDPDGGVVQVSFYAGGTLLGESSAAPFEMTWNGAGLGSYILSVRAVDDGGLETHFSLPVRVAAQSSESNQPPQVSITTPDEGAVYPTGWPVRIEAQAYDADGRIDRVEFYLGETLLGSVASPPYTIWWLDAPTGSFALVARAFDDRGASASYPVRINILPPNGTAPPVPVTDFVYFPLVRVP